MNPLFDTERLELRELTEADTGFYLAMLSDPDFKANIADRGVRTEEQALASMRDRVFTSYEVYGFGMWLVSRRDTGEALGMAGLVKRDFLKHVDLGYSFLPAGRGAGYATEAARGVMGYARREYGLSQLAAITAPHNRASIRVLQRLGFSHLGQVSFPDDGEICEHFLVDLPSA